MPTCTAGGSLSNEKDFFVSYNKDNKDWAKWIAGTLEENGYSVYLQAWDIAPGDDFISRMNDFLKYSKNYLAVLSKSFWESEYCKKEFQTAFNAHLNKDIVKFLPVRIADIASDALYNTIVYVDLFNLDESLATAKLLQAVGHTINPRKKGPFPQDKRTEDIHTSNMSSFPGQIESAKYKDTIAQNTKIRNIIALDESGNNYDCAAAIHLAALTNYWTLSSIRQNLKKHKFLLNMRVEKSRFLTELGLFEKSEEKKQLQTV